MLLGDILKAQYVFAMSRMRCNLSNGRDAFISMVFSVMPRNSRVVSGPIVFSSDGGTPRDSKQRLSMKREAPELS